MQNAPTQKPPWFFFAVLRCRSYLVLFFQKQNPGEESSGKRSQQRWSMSFIHTSRDGLQIIKSGVQGLHIRFSIQVNTKTPRSFLLRCCIFTLLHFVLNYISLHVLSGGWLLHIFNNCPMQIVWCVFSMNCFTSTSWVQNQLLFNVYLIKLEGSICPLYSIRLSSYAMKYPVVRITQFSTVHTNWIVSHVLM